MSDKLLLKKNEILSRIDAARRRGGFEHDVTLIAVTKYQTIEAANAAIAAGITDVAENYVQALVSRAPLLMPCKIHMIGHLQTNKVKQLFGVKNLAMIQSVDSAHLAQEISKQAKKTEKDIDILIQVNIADEQTKFGLDPADVRSTVEAVSGMDNVKIKGFMSIMPIGADRIYYEKMNDLFCNYQALGIPNTEFKYLSMGMSGDFETAVECGANMVRIGSYLFE